MNTDIELKNHLICEFLIRKSAPSVLLEARGVVNNIDEVVDAFMEAFQKQITETFTRLTDRVQSYNNSNILDGIDTFFTNFNIYLTTRKSPKVTYNGVMQPSSIKRNNDTNLWYCVPDIYLTAGAPNEKKLYQVISFALAHELTHCYNLLQYAIQNNKQFEDEIFQNIENQRYFDINKGKNSTENNEKALSYVLYYLNRMERNAYLAQLRQELLSEKDKMVDDKSIFTLIRNSESYSKLKEIERNINAVNSINDEETKKQLIVYLNTIMNRKFTTYNQVKKYLNSRWSKWKKNYLIKATKIAYDVYSTTNHSKWLDWGMMGKKSPTIK